MTKQQQGLNYEAMKAEAAGRRTTTGWKPKEGENYVRVLPPHSRFLTDWDAMRSFAVIYKIHFFRIEGRQTSVSRCLEDLGDAKARCPACEAWRLHRQAEDPALAEMAKNIKAASQYLMNIIDLSDTDAGIQPWAANYTCWDKILEIGTSPKWGNVFDPDSGTNFTVKLTPGQNTRTGYNQYAVTPDREPTDVSEVLGEIEDWQDKLDHLDDLVPAPMEADDIAELLEEMGFPPPPAPRRRAAPAATKWDDDSDATPTMAAGPKTVRAIKVPAKVKPVAKVRPVAKPVAAVQQEEEDGGEEDGESEQGGAVHYDPGPKYQPKVPESERPENAPRCFGDFDPRVHACRGAGGVCPVLAACQIKGLNIV